MGKASQDPYRITHRSGWLAGLSKLRCLKNDDDDENENNESVIPSEERDLASRLAKSLCGVLLTPCAAAHQRRTYAYRVIVRKLTQ